MRQPTTPCPALLDQLLLTELVSEPGWRRIRTRGPDPTLADSEVLSIEVTGECLELDQDVAIIPYFRREHPDFFPALGQVHRTTFARQAANPWVVKERLWAPVRDRLPHDPTFPFIDISTDASCKRNRRRWHQGKMSSGWRPSHQR